MQRLPKENPSLPKTLLIQRQSQPDAKHPVLEMLRRIQPRHQKKIQTNRAIPNLHQLLITPGHQPLKNKITEHSKRY